MRVLVMAGSMSAAPEPVPAPALRPATRADLPAVLALLGDEERVVDPATVVVDEVVVNEAYERAFAAGVASLSGRSVRCGRP
jgi:hypothetical protein